MEFNKNNPAYISHVNNEFSKLLTPLNIKESHYILNLSDPYGNRISALNLNKKQLDAIKEIILAGDLF